MLYKDQKTRLLAEAPSKTDARLAFKQAGVVMSELSGTWRLREVEIVDGVACELEKVPSVKKMKKEGVV